MHGRGGSPARAAADEAVPHLAADVAARRLGAAQGGQARRRLRPPRGHGQPRTRSVTKPLIDHNYKLWYMLSFIRGAIQYSLKIVPKTVLKNPSKSTVKRLKK